MKIVLAFDSFKGSLSASEVCDVVSEGIQSVRPDITLLSVPMADGGEGTAETLKSALNGEWIPIEVTGPLFSMQVKSGFVWLAEQKLAIVEMASATGLPLLSSEQRNPMQVTSFGTGELIKAAIAKGAEKILLCLGGSANIEGGIGAAAALGWKFLDHRGHEVPLTGEGLAFIKEIQPPINNCIPEIIVLCDVTNPLCGKEGAAHIFGAQKGATAEMINQLDDSLRLFSETISNALNKQVREVKGAGAAGGLGAGAIAFFDAKLVPGIDTVMSVCNLTECLNEAEWVLTGEGCFDQQSLHGKVVDGISRLAADAGAKTFVIAGTVKLTKTEWELAGIDSAIAIKKEGMSTDESIRNCRELLFERAVEFARTL